MKKIVLLIGLLLVQWCGVAQAPVITNFAPASGPIGSTVVISGTGFNSLTTQNIVFFGATRATVTAASITSLTVMVPVGATYKNISMTNLAVNLTAYTAKPFLVTLPGRISFANKQDYYVGTGGGSGLQAVCTADIDGDGKSDLVTAANGGGSPITVLRNASTPGITDFFLRVNIGTGGYPFISLTVGDVDGDGKPDVIGISEFNIVSIFRNTSSLGNISFADYLTFTTGSQSKSVSIGDIDGDGKSDLAVSNGAGNNISVLRNTSTVGIISFAAKVDFLVANNNTSVSIGDIDGDGKVDLMAANGNFNNVSILRNTSIPGTISFATKVDFVTGTNSSSLCIGDIDGNGKLDIAITNRNANTLSVLRNTSTVGVLSFAAKVDFATSTSPYAIAIGDIDGDGKPDLAVANSTANTLSVLRNSSVSGAISFIPKVDFATGNGPLYVSIGDIDGDGAPDVAVANYTYNAVSVFQQLPLVTIATFSPASGPIGTSVTITGTGFNTTAEQNVVFFGATKATVTVASSTSLTVTVPLGATFQNISVTNLAIALTGYSAKPFIVTLAGNIAFGNKQDFAASSTPISVSIGDIDSDGKSDMVVANFNSNVVSVYRNISTPGNTNLTPKVDFVTNSNPNVVKLMDIDGDGKPDLIVLNRDINKMSVFRNTSVSGTIIFAAKVDLTTGVNPNDVSMGDINKDGIPDLVVSNANGNSVSVFRNMSTLGSVIFAAKVDFAAPNVPLSVGIEDIDGDGKSDVIVANNSSTLAVFRNTTITATNTISFATRVDFSVDGSTSSSKIGDIDGDGKLDIATSNYSNNVVTILRNTSTIGLLSFAAKVNFATGVTHLHLSIGDIDGDGKLDISTSNNESNSISVLRSLSTPGLVNFAAKVDFTTGDGPRSNNIGDIDGDGKPDLVVVNSGSSTLSVFRQLDLPQGSLNSSGPICTSGSGQLTFVATAGTGPFTVVYSDGTADRTVTGVVSGIPFNVFTNPVTSTTTYTLVSVSYPNYAIRTTGFTGASTSITVNTPSVTPTSVTGNTSIPCGGNTTLTVEGGFAGSGAIAQWFTDSCGGTLLGTGSSILVSPDNSTTYYVRYSGTCNTTQCTSVIVTVVGCISIVNLKLFIEGYYQGSGVMDSVKNNQDGVSSSDEVENITVELHSATSPYATFVTTTALLKTDGTVVCTFPIAPTGSYYLVVRARNALKTWSASPITISSSTPLYDFSNLASKAYGLNMVQVESGIWAFYSGDLNNDEAVDASDAPSLFYDIENSEFGDKPTDLNGDGVVDNTDLPFFMDNSGNSIFTIKP